MEKKISRRRFLKDLTDVAVMTGVSLGINFAFGNPIGEFLYGRRDRRVSENEENYKGFKFPEELEDILKHSERVGVEPELLMAIRSAENGRDAIAYGILPQGESKKVYDQDEGYQLGGMFIPYSSEKEKQLSWVAWTVKNNQKRFSKNSEGYKDFISYLASRYAPIGARNDPNELNNHWEKNVRSFYEKFKKN